MILIISNLYLLQVLIKLSGNQSYKINFNEGQSTIFGGSGSEVALLHKSTLNSINLVISEITENSIWIYLYL